MKNTSILLFPLLILFLPTAAQAEVEAVLALGRAVVEETDLVLSRSGGTHLTYSSVGWRDESFKMPLYLSLRGGTVEVEPRLHQLIVGLSVRR